MTKRANFLNRYFFLILIILMAANFVGHYHARTGLISYYKDFGRMINSGFKIKIDNPTFPMWGYGFIYAITDNKIVILLLQFFLSFFVICVIERFSRHIFKTNQAKMFFKILLLFSFSWFVFNATLWPYSIAANFATLSLILLYYFFNTERLRYLILSAGLFGTTLNFRSDYFLYPLFLFAILLIVKFYFFRKKILTGLKIRYIFVWVITIYLFLAPYAIYAKKSTGHYLFTSTNGGAALYLSLGQLPNNKWGITPIDGDPVMAETVNKQFNANTNKSTSAYDYIADIFLKKQYLIMVINKPFEYFKKIIYSTGLVLTGGFYAGEYLNWVTPPGRTAAIHQEIKASLKEMNFKNIFSILRKEGMIFVLLYFPEKLFVVYGKMLFIFFNFSLLFFIYKRFYRTDYLLSLTFLSMIFYQFTLCTLVYYMCSYITNLYLIYIFIISWAIDCRLNKA